MDSEGKIKSVGPSGRVVQRNPGEEIQGYGEATILPGLSDMHVHLDYYYNQPGLSECDDYMIAYYTLKQVVYALGLGITTVRDLASPYNPCKKTRMAGRTGFIEVPRIFHTHTRIYMMGGYGHEGGIIEVDDVWSLRREIHRQFRDGVGWIKILTSNRENFPEPTQEELEAAVDECRRRDTKTAVHADTQPVIQMCIGAGLSTIEHGTFVTLAQAEQMAENNQAQVPTTTVYTYLYKYTKRLIEEDGNPSNSASARMVKDQAFFEPAANTYKNNFEKLHGTDVTVLAGFGMMFYGAPPLPIHQEFACMVEYGTTPVQATATATGNPSRVMGLEKITGLSRLEPQADLLTVQGNAAKDIHAPDEVLGVYLSGRLVRGD